MQQEQARLWKEYINWEKSNPQRLDNASVAQRVTLAYDQALMPLMHYPEVWYSHSRWHAVEGGGGPATALAVLSKARSMLPRCALLQFAAAELEEARGETDNARALYEEQVDALPAPSEPSTSGAKEVSQEEREAGTLLWIQYMCFARRVDGVAMSRKIFLRARRWHGCSWQAFVAAARMEYAGDGNDRVARNIYELGLEHFMAVPGYVLQYVEFLIGLADMHNARALFERAIGETPPEESKPLWDRYIEFQSMHGDLATVQQLEQRRREALGPDSTDDINVLILKSRFLDIWPCTAPQKSHLQRLFGTLPPLSNPAAPNLQPATTSLAQGQAGDASQRQNASSPSPTHQASAHPLQHKPEPIKQMPAELGSFLSSLPPARAVEPPYASVDAVIDILMKADLSATALANLEASLHRRPPVMLPAPVTLPHPSKGWDRGAIKRDREEPEAGEIMDNAPAVDMYRARAKQRIKKGG